MRETMNETHYEYLLKLCLGLDYIIGLIFGTKKTHYSSLPYKKQGKVRPYFLKLFLFTFIH